MHVKGKVIFKKVRPGKHKYLSAWSSLSSKENKEEKKIISIAVFSTRFS